MLPSGGFELLGDITVSAASAVTYDNTTLGTGSGQFEYVGTWQSTTVREGFNFSKASGAYYQIDFTGESIEVWGPQANDCGVLAWSIDGGPETLVDTYVDVSAPLPSRQFVANGLSNTAHTLKVRVTGTKRAAALDSYVSVSHVIVRSGSGATEYGILTTSSYNNKVRGGPYDVANERAVFEIVNFNPVAGRQLNFTMYSSAGNSDNVNIQFAKSSAGTEGPKVRYQVDWSQQASFEYDPALHRWGSIRLEGADAIFEVSADGETWTNPLRVPHLLPTGSCYISVQAYDPTAGTDRTVVRNINQLPVSVAPDNAGPDQTVAAGSPVTLSGSPAGKTWSQVSGPAVSIDDTFTTPDYTGIVFDASNPSTTDPAVRVFQYGSDQVTVTAQPAIVGGTDVLQQPFDQPDGSPWPAPFVIQAAGGAATSGATVQGGRGRFTLPVLNTYPVISARADIGIADIEIEFEVGGTVNATLPELYREVHLRMTPGANAASGLADAYLLTAEPGKTPGLPWRVYLRRRRNGVNKVLGASGSLPTGVRFMKGRFKAVGRRLQGRVWDAAQPEPNTWMFDHTDTDAEAILTAGSLALVGVGGGNTKDAPFYIDFDVIHVREAAAAPTITATAPASTVWPDPVALSVVGEGYTALKWSVASAPPGSVATVTDDTLADATFVPDTDGLYEFEIVASTFSSSTRKVVQTFVGAQMWLYNADLRRVPVAVEQYD